MTRTDTAAPAITPEIANHVLFHYGRGGYQAGNFTTQLISTIAAADMQNMARLALGFPGYTAAVIGMQYDRDALAWLTKLAGGEGPHACPSCGDTAGPFDLNTGRCEDCLPGGAA
jgi:hypothetical protein